MESLGETEGDALLGETKERAALFFSLKKLKKLPVTTTRFLDTPCAGQYPMSQIEVKRCGAKTRQGKACAGLAMINGRCRMHGEKSLRWVLHPRYKHGLYSNAIYTAGGERGHYLMRPNPALVAYT